LLLATVAALTLVAPAHGSELAGPTADQLKAKTSGCETQLSAGKYAHDSGGSRTVAYAVVGDQGPAGIIGPR
jgi:hypothetical protein